MIEIGKYTIEDWSVVDKYLDYDYVKCERKLLYYNNKTSFSISIRTDFLHEDAYKIWHIHYGLIQIKLMFMKLYNNEIYRYFNTIEEGKDYIDYSLKKMRNLRAFI